MVYSLDWAFRGLTTNDRLKKQGKRHTLRVLKTEERLIKSENRIQRQKMRGIGIHGFSENERHRREQERLLIQADRIMWQNQRELSRAQYSRMRGRGFVPLSGDELKKEAKALKWHGKWAKRMARWEHRSTKFQK